ncbi:hypothetical protein HDU83_008389 [Entophlyctis luteolus]|nr:hypothetical protein HDU82_000008 [Entophlyctis luteolus]KAJ3338004.1 hypothetical protein HDU83_008389 [Entophlyctis luteolus]KAJ3392580.1 hypothetical protein HDU84_003829 [Entophlyctis sp. JEL0112]
MNLSKRTSKQLAAIAALVTIVVLTIATLALHSASPDLADLSSSSSSSQSKMSFNSISWLWSDSSSRKFSAPGEPIMGAMKNETVKAELGRSAWRLLHTMAGKFPAKPTKTQMAAMNDFIYLFGQLYPCGDCAKHFKVILEQHPPDVSSKQAIANWACMVHNIVNKRKGKELFDCSKILEFYDCGCGMGSV